MVVVVVTVVVVAAVVVVVVAVAVVVVVAVVMEGVVEACQRPMVWFTTFPLSVYGSSRATFNLMPCKCMHVTSVAVC